MSVCCVYHKPRNFAESSSSSSASSDSSSKNHLVVRTRVFRFHNKTTKETKDTTTTTSWKISQEGAGFSDSEKNFRAVIVCFRGKQRQEWTLSVFAHFHHLGEHEQRGHFQRGDFSSSSCFPFYDLQQKHHSSNGSLYSPVRIWGDLLLFSVPVCGELFSVVFGKLPASCLERKHACPVILVGDAVNSP